MKIVLKRILKFVVLPVLALVVVLIVVSLGYRAYLQSQTADEMVINTPNGIDVYAARTIGGVDQWVSIRGRDPAKPILVYVHGGPGSSMIPFIHSYQIPWEEHFTVVNWEQRGAGRTYRTNGEASYDDISLDLIVADGLELVEALLREFDQDKVFIIGHSWGSVVGVHMVKRRPDLFHAYIGTGQVVNMQDNERVSYDFVIEKARQLGDTDALAKLAEIGPPPYNTGTADETAGKIMDQRKILMEYGGAMRIPGGYLGMGKVILEGRDLSLIDLYYWMKGSVASISHFDAELWSIDLPTLGPVFDIPMFFFIGRHDYQTPFSLSEAYFEAIEAPLKAFVWFEDSAHGPPQTMSSKFLDEMLTRVLPAADIAGEKKK